MTKLPTPCVLNLDGWYDVGVQAANGERVVPVLDDPLLWSYQENRIACEQGYKDQQLRNLLNQEK